MLLSIPMMLLGVSGCLRKTEILYARATRLPEELKGFMRVAEPRVRVNVVGTDKAAEIECAGYIVIHEQDLAALVKAAQELKRLRETPP